MAILLHYFFLAAFSWMFCEGLLLFILLQFVFYKGLLKTKKFYFLIGWSEYKIALIYYSVIYIPKFIYISNMAHTNDYKVLRGVRLWLYVNIRVMYMC